MVPLFVAVPIGSMLAWKRGDLPGVLARLTAPRWPPWPPSSSTCCSRRQPGARRSGHRPRRLGRRRRRSTSSAARVRLFRGPLAQSLARARGLPRSAWGMTLAHIGLGVAHPRHHRSSAWQDRARSWSMRPGDTHRPRRLRRPLRRRGAACRARTTRPSAATLQDDPRWRAGHQPRPPRSASTRSSGCRPPRPAIHTMRSATSTSSWATRRRTARWTVRALPQPAGALDLGRRPDHGAWAASLADRPPAARRRAAAGRRRSRPPRRA